VIIVESSSHSETGPQRRAHHARTRGCADQRELWQVQTKTSRLRSLVDNNVEPVIFHRGIEIFFDGRLEPMNFVNEKHVAFFQAREKAGQFARFFNYRATGILDVHIHRISDDVSESRFPETGWTAQ